MNKSGSIIGGIKGGIIDGIIDGTISNIIEELTDRQKEFLMLIQENKKLSVTGVSKKLDINRSAAQTYFDTLKDKGTKRESEEQEGIGVNFL